MDANKKTINDYPHIKKAIDLLWGHPEIYEYFDSLFLMDRKNIRQGLDADVMEELYNLEKQHEGLVKRPIKKDIWGTNPKFF